MNSPPPFSDPAHLLSGRSGRERLLLQVVWSGLFLLTLTGGLCAAEPERVLTGAEFNRALNRPLLVNQDYTPFRQVLDRLSKGREVAICLDRRIDPEQLVLVDINSPYFDSGIGHLARQASADLVVVADTIFVTTPETSTTLRTRIALADRELKNLSKPNLQRQLELSHKIPLKWDRLTQPKELLVSFAESFHVQIENPEAIPYDLWEAGCFSRTDFNTGVLLIACQFNLEFSWIDSRNIRLIPQSPNPRIELDHPLRGRSEQQVSELMAQQFPDSGFRVTSNRLNLNARVEEHEALDLALGNKAPRKPAASVIDTSLANRRFTLRMTSRPFLELLEVLEKQGIQFHRDDARLQAAGIDLNQKISLELENATIQQLLTDACTPLGLAFQIEGTRVALGLAPRPVPPRSGR